MMILSKVLVFFALALLPVAFILKADMGAMDKNVNSMSASQKGIELLGAILHNSPFENTNVVLIKNLSTKQTMAKKVGSALALEDSYIITAVRADFIELQGSGRKLRLYKYGVPPPEQKAKEVEKKVIAITGAHKEDGFEREGGKIKITEEYRKNLLEKDLPKILMQAAAEAQMDANGNILGFGLFDIEKDSVYAKLGLQDGDIVKSLNGEELNSPQGAIKLLNSLRGSNNVQIVIERNGTSLSLDLDVK